MDIQFIESLIECSKAILSEVVKVDTLQIESSIQQGASTSEGNGVVLKVEGDIEGSMIIDLSKQLFFQIALAMAGETDLRSMANDENEYIELLKSVVLEFGNLINGRIIGTMHRHSYKYKSYPDYAYYENFAILAPKTVSVIIIEAKTAIGNYNIYVTNKKEKFKENIVVLLFDLDSKLSQPIVKKYTPNGYFFLNNANLEISQKIVKEKNINFLLINIDNMKNPHTTLQNFLKANPSLNIIIFTSEDAAMISDLIKTQNVVGYISNKVPPDVLITNIEFYFDRAGIKKTERRQHVRIKTSLLDNARMSSWYKSRMISGDVLDIGLGGMMTAIEGGVNPELFTFGEEINDIKIRISDKELKINGTIRSKRGNMVSIEFVNIDEQNSDALSQYVFERISSDASLQQI